MKGSIAYIFSPAINWINFTMDALKLHGKLQEYDWKSIFSPQELEKYSTSDVANLHLFGLGSIKPFKPSKMFKKYAGETKNKDSFVAKRDEKFERCMGEIESDGDIWVERFYINKNGGRNYYYRSFKTGRCSYLDPPTGSAVVVYWDELQDYPFLHECATEPLGEKLPNILERPDYNDKKGRKTSKKGLDFGATKGRRKVTGAKSDKHDPEKISEEIRIEWP